MSIELAKAGIEMRKLQKRYFRLAIEVKKQNYHPDIILEKKKVLEASKDAERRFDTLCKQLLDREERARELRLFK